MQKNGGSRTESTYQRYHIETQEAPDRVRWPSRFKVKVSKIGLARHLLTELIHTRLDMDVVTSRPCMYGVYSGPVGGFAPREHLCVGCLRCTTEFPDFTQILPNPERKALGDSYFNFRHVEAAAYEAEGGRIPVKGAGYRGQFGGPGWDGMWTDMSEIVRPTRDGIHGREFISTVVDIGRRPDYLLFNDYGQLAGPAPSTLQIPVPFIFDRVHPGLESAALYKILAQSAGEVQTLQVLPLDMILDFNLRGLQIVPLLRAGDEERLAAVPFSPRLVELDGWETGLYQAVVSRWPQTQVALRLPFEQAQGVLGYLDEGVHVFHLTSDYHGRDPQGRFVFDLIREVHGALVEAGRRGQVTLLGSGGIVAAEHVPKALIAGLDAVALDLPLLVALQGRFSGEFTGRDGSAMTLPADIPADWGVQRVKNLSAAWRDQLLEVLGAMGLREVRRLRGEMGRALFMVNLEREAFAGIEGYDG